MKRIINNAIDVSIFIAGMCALLGFLALKGALTPVGHFRSWLRRRKA